MPSDDESSCFECGGPCFLTEAGVAHHGTPDAIDYDADADHVALPEEGSVGNTVTCMYCGGEFPDEECENGPGGAGSVCRKCRRFDDCPQCLMPTMPAVGDNQCEHCGYAGDDTFVCRTCGNPATIDDDGLTRHLRRRSRGDGALFYDEEMDATHLPMPDPDIEPEDKPIWPI